MDKELGEMDLVATRVDDINKVVESKDLIDTK